MKNSIMPSKRFQFFVFPVFCFLLSPVLLAAPPTIALPPATDIPEEVLRNEIITEARSPINGEPLTASEYAELQEELQKDPELQNTIDPQIRYLIFLLQVRRSLRIIVPFIP